MAYWPFQRPSDTSVAPAAKDRRVQKLKYPLKAGALATCTGDSEPVCTGAPFSYTVMLNLFTILLCCVTADV